MKKRNQKRTGSKSRILYIGVCDMCKKDIDSDDAFVIYEKKKKRCWECHRVESEQHERQRQDQDT